MMTGFAWTFLDYVESTGRNPIRDWLREQPRDAEAWIDQQILLMARMQKWPDKWVSRYKGLDGIYEMRIPFKNVQYRPLGMYAKGRVFIILCGAIEKGNAIPKRDLETAVRRRKVILKEPQRVKPHELVP